MSTPKRKDKIIKTETTSMLIDVLEPYLSGTEELSKFLSFTFPYKKMGGFFTSLLQLQVK